MASIANNKSVGEPIEELKRKSSETNLREKTPSSSKERTDNRSKKSIGGKKKKRKRKDSNKPIMAVIQ